MIKLHAKPFTSWDTGQYNITSVHK